MENEWRVWYEHLSKSDQTVSSFLDLDNLAADPSTSC